MDLYRIISLETFVDLLHNKRERYVRPATWDDNYEGYLFGRINNPVDRKEIIRDMYDNICSRNYKGVIDNLITLEHGKYFVYGQCWSKLAESDALWRIYAYNNHSVQIKTTDECIENLLKNISGIEFEKKEVLYDVEPDDNLLHKQVMQLKETKKIYEPFFHKRSAFEHEKEFRVLIDDATRYQMSEMIKIMANWEIDDIMQGLPNDEDRTKTIDEKLDQNMGHWEGKNLPNDYYVTIEKINGYILGVKINPFAEKWYVDLIRGLCEEYEIPFDGQSDLYGKREQH